MRICLRRVRDAVHGDIRRCGKAALRLADILAHGGILACDFRQRAIAAIDGFLIFFRFSRIEERPCEVPDGGRARARSPFLRMEAGAARAIHSARLHRDAARGGHRIECAGVLRGDADIFRRRNGSQKRRLGRSVDVVVCDGRADACLSGDSDRTADVDILRIIFCSDDNVTGRGNHRLPDRGFRGVFETVHIHRPVDGNGLPFATRSRHGEVPAFVFCRNADILRLRHSHAIFHGGFGGILLMHSEGCAAQCGFPTAGERTSPDVFPEIETPRLVADRRFDVTAEIHGVNVILRADGEIAIVDFYFRILFYRRFRGVVVLHDIQCRRAGDFLTRAARLCPGVRQIRQLEAIVRIKNGLKVICKILAEAFEIRLPGALRLRADIHISFGLDIARQLGFCLVILVDIVHRRRDAGALVRTLADTCLHLRPRQGLRVYIDCARTACSIIAAHFARKGCLCTIVAEEESRRGIETEAAARTCRSGLISRTRSRVRRFLLGRLIAPELLDARHELIALTLGRRYVHDVVDGIRAGAIIAFALARDVERIGVIFSIFVRHRILRVDTDLAICIDFALHIGRCLRLGLDDADREAQRAVAAAVLDLNGEISLCLRRYVYIFFRLQRRIFRYSDGCICLRFRPSKVDRDRKIFHAALPLEIDGVTAFRRNREILLCREHTFPLDFYFRRNVRDADIDPDAESAARLTADFRLCLRGNRKVFRCGELRILDRHARVCARLHDRRQTSHLFTKGLMEQSEDAILFCTCLVRIRRADLAADFCLRGNRYILPLDGGIRNLDRSIRLTAHEISAIPFCAGDDRRVAACRVHVCLVNDDRALRLERLCHRRCADCCERNVTMTQSLRNRCRW